MLELGGSRQRCQIVGRGGAVARSPFGNRFGASVHPDNEYFIRVAKYPSGWFGFNDVVTHIHGLQNFTQHVWMEEELEMFVKNLNLNKIYV